jgi:hypothetical protein
VSAEEAAVSAPLNDVDADVREHLRLRDEAWAWLLGKVGEGVAPDAVAAALVATAVRILSSDDVASLAKLRAQICGTRVWQDALENF